MIEHKDNHLLIMSGHSITVHLGKKKLDKCTPSILLRVSFVNVY